MMPWLIGFWTILKVGMSGSVCRNRYEWLCKEGTVFTEPDKFMTPETLRSSYQRMNFVNEFDSNLFGGVLKMSMVVGEERSDSALQEIKL